MELPRPIIIGFLVAMFAVFVWAIVTTRPNPTVVAQFAPAQKATYTVTGPTLAQVEVTYKGVGLTGSADKTETVTLPWTGHAPYQHGTPLAIAARLVSGSDVLTCTIQLASEPAPADQQSKAGQVACATVVP